MPAWLQIRAANNPINNRAARCLITKHKTSTIADLIRTSARIRERENDHRPINFCNCRPCRDDHNRDCTHPHKCAKEAMTRLLASTPLWNPLDPRAKHNKLSLTHQRKEQNRRAREQNGTITFNPSLTTKDNISECFRVFTDPPKISRIPAQRARNDQVNARHNKVTAYTDGACLNNGKENARCGGGVWFRPSDP